jgi:hypothetical protein
VTGEPTPIEELAAAERLEQLENRICRVESALQIPIRFVEWVKRVLGTT